MIKKENIHSEPKRMIDIINKMNCCGCASCESICPKQAIEMKPDVYGFLYPVIDEDKCVNCGRCLKACFLEQGYDTSGNFKKPINYAARHKDIKEVEKSRSGGVFKAVSDYILSLGGVVYGAAFDETWKVVHIRVETVEELDRLRGSKYTQSDLRGIFSSVSNDLKSNRKVIFSGTPCQCAGLKLYLKSKRIDMVNLYILDIVCHGVPSPSIWSEYVRMIENKYGKILSINMRDKKIVGWNGHEESFRFENKTIYKHSFRVVFYTELTSRESCYNCKFANLNRPSDLSLADFWNWEKNAPDLNRDNKGISQILINTDKGLNLFKMSCSSLYFQETDTESSIQYNMQHPTHRPEGRDEAELYYKNHGFMPFMCRYSDSNIYTWALMKYRRLKHLYSNYKIYNREL